MNEKILCVDDDLKILAGFKRNLRKFFDIDTAIGGEEGLKRFSSKIPYAVVVSDLKMPKMDGIEFLSRVKKMSPDTARIMLTGYADVNNAINAVNEGEIFRFLTKPCSPDSFAKAIYAGIKQYQLITAERELLEKTLKGSIKVLVDILALANPIAFSRSQRLQKYVRHISRGLELQNTWMFELSAMLSQIGCIALPPEILEKVYSGKEMEKDEGDMFLNHPSIGFDLLKNIPRMESIAKIIEKHNKPFSGFPQEEKPENRDKVDLGAQMLKVAFEFDRLIRGGKSYEEAVPELLRFPEICDPVIVETLKTISKKIVGVQIKQVKIAGLDVGMVIDQEIRTNKGILVVAKGEEINYPLLAQLKNYWRQGIIDNKLHVLMPMEKIGMGQVLTKK